MTAPTCTRCESKRDPLLVGVLPCEFCGAQPDAVAEVELPADDSWSGTLGHADVSVAPPPPVVFDWDEFYARCRAQTEGDPAAQARLEAFRSLANRIGM